MPMCGASGCQPMPSVRLRPLGYPCRMPLPPRPCPAHGAPAAIRPAAAASPSAWATALNVAGSQLGWFGCVLSAAHGEPAWGVALAVLLLALHLGPGPARRGEWLLVLAVAAIGWLWDSAVAAAGLIRYDAGLWVPGMAPVWIAALWALFAATLLHSLRWLQGRWGWAAALGAVAGPSAFYGGTKLGAAVFPEPLAALAVLAIGWAVLLPLVVGLAGRVEAIAAGSGTGSGSASPTGSTSQIDPTRRHDA